MKALTKTLMSLVVSTVTFFASRCESTKTDKKDSDQDEWVRVVGLTMPDAASTAPDPIDHVQPAPLPAQDRPSTTGTFNDGALRVLISPDGL
jgi:predicted amidohydrolase YtcJ